MLKLGRVQNWKKYAASATNRNFWRGHEQYHKAEQSSAKRWLLFYLDQYLDPFYQNDLSELNEPINSSFSSVVPATNF